MTREEIQAMADNAVRVFEKAIGRAATELEAAIVREGIALHALEIAASKALH